MSTEDQIDFIEASSIHYDRKMIMIALIRLGRWTTLECQYPNCVLPGIDLLFEPGRDPRQAQVDHILWRANGGGNRPENLRVVHRLCNNAHSNSEWSERAKSTRAENNSVVTICPSCGRECRGQQGLKLHQSFTPSCSSDPQAAQDRVSAMVIRNKRDSHKEATRRGVKAWHAARGTAVAEPSEPKKCWCGVEIHKDRTYCSRAHSNSRPKPPESEVGPR